MSVIGPVTGRCEDPGSCPNPSGKVLPAPVAEECSASTFIAAEVKSLVLAGRLPEAHQRFGALVADRQRRALRLAYHMLGNAADAEEAVQDAFVKVFEHIRRFREDSPFDAWFNRILVNTCLDRRKAHMRRHRWFRWLDAGPDQQNEVERTPDTGSNPEEALIANERRARLNGAIQRLPERQRTVFLLSQLDGRSAREVGAATGLSESTVRVHLFRAIRKLRLMLEGTVVAR
jgi:RNA polymerase sigma-70 factor, ECF subfamily